MYGGTKAELERLIADAASYTDIQKEMGITVDASSMSFDNIVNAIAVVQGKLGIAGATAEEAGTTIEGSVNSMKAAWANLVTGFASGNADIEGLINNLVTTIVGDGTENNLGVLGNILPAVETALGGIVKLIEGAVPKLVEMLPGLVGKILPAIISAAVSIVNSLSQALPDLLSILINSIMTSMPLIISGIVTAFQAVVEMLPELIQQIADALPTLVPQIIVGMVQMVVILVKNLPMILASLVKALINLFVGAWNGIKEVFSLSRVGEFFSSVLKAIKSPFGSIALWFSETFSGAWEAVKRVFSAGGRIFDGITTGILNGLKSVINAIIKGINKVVSVPFGGLNAALRGLRSANILGAKPFSWIETISVPKIPLLEKGGIVDGATLAMIGENGREAIVPLENNKGWIKEIAGELGNYVGGGGDIYININGAKYSDENELAEVIAQKLQSMTDRRSAVYA